MTASAKEASNEGKIKTFDGPRPRGSRPIDLVFRTVGERTSDLALELAIQHVGPQRVHVIKNVKPFSRAVSRMLELDHGEATHVVHMDADCLILEDMRPFLEDDELPYVDCYVHDRFRGRIHCGVHVTRIDVVRTMAEVPVPEDDLAYVLRPESRLRNLALAELGAEKQLKGFAILHDHFQRYTDIFAKYALRELRSRSEFQKKRLEASMARWGPGTDYDVARAAVGHAARTVPEGAKPKHVEAYIRNLPFIAEEQLERMGLGGQSDLTMDEVRPVMEQAPWRGPPSRPKVFGLGLSRTGARSLTAALHVLGVHTVHAPTDARSLEAIRRGDGQFPLLAHYDGITDLAAIPCFVALDRAHPGAKFVLTIRDEEAWLRSCEAHWASHPEGAPPTSQRPSALAEHQLAMEARRLLREQVFGTTTFDRERFRAVRRAHEERVRRHFAGRQNLLVLDVTRGAAWRELADFLGCDVPDQPWPHKGRQLTAKQLAALEPDD